MGFDLVTENQQVLEDYFQQAQTIWMHLTETAPEMVEFQNNLNGVKGQLENL